MPHFFFHVVDGTDLLDDNGAQFPDVGAAKAEAVRLAGAVLSHSDSARFLQDHPWRVLVSDSPHPEKGHTFFTLIISAEEGGSPSAGRPEMGDVSQSAG
jgi:hypothetical protein